MRYYCLLLTCLFSLSTKGQFYVLEARNANYNQRVLYAQDTVSNQGTLSVRENGFLSMIHSSGKTLELKGDTALDLSMVSWTSWGTDFKTPSYMDLFQPPPSTGAVEAGLPEITSLFGRTTYRLESNQSVCLKWKTRRSYDGQYSVHFLNLFYEPIADSVTISENQFLLDFEAMRFEPNPYKNIVMVNVKQQQYPFSQDLVAAIEVSKESYILPDFCDPNTATQAVLLAHYLERAVLINFAMNYYQKATILSEERVFQDILAKAKNRLNRE